MTFQEFLATLTDEDLDFIAGLDYGQDVALHREALEITIANGGVVDTDTQGVWYPLEVLELGRHVLQAGRERAYALCAGIVLQTGAQDDEAENLVENHAEDIAALPDDLRAMLQAMILDQIAGR